jgi:hypothetical protein
MTNRSASPIVSVPGSDGVSTEQRLPLSCEEAGGWSCLSQSLQDHEGEVVGASLLSACCQLARPARTAKVSTMLCVFPSGRTKLYW